MLNFDDNSGLVNRGQFEQALIYVCQAQLADVAAKTGLELFSDSFQVFGGEIQKALARPDRQFTSAELLFQARLLAVRGAERMLLTGNKRFHETTWDEVRATLAIWPFD